MKSIIRISNVTTSTYKILLASSWDEEEMDTVVIVHVEAFQMVLVLCEFKKKVHQSTVLSDNFNSNLTCTNYDGSL